MKKDARDRNYPPKKGIQFVGASLTILIYCQFSYYFTKCQDKSKMKLGGCSNLKIKERVKVNIPGYYGCDRFFPFYFHKV